MILRRLYIPGILFSCVFSNVLFGQIKDSLNLNQKNINSEVNDSLKQDQKSNIKKGWTFGASPVLGFDSNIGFRYGAMVDVFNYGKGTKYPQYSDRVQLLWSMTTKGSGTNTVIFDSYSVIKKVRTTFECSYLTEQTLDFYGFNGYAANYNRAIEDKTSSSYLSALFYKMDRKLVRIRSEFQGKLGIDHLKWLAGFTLYDIKLDTVDINALNRGRSGPDKYPYVNGGLFGEYERYGLLPKNELKGGTNYLLKAGIIYDTRDNEANPMRGVWSDLQLIMAPTFIGNEKGFIRISASHRQYFTIIPKKLSLACRISVQNRLVGTIPFYMLPFVHYLTPYTDNDGLGGVKTLRGIIRNRVVGDGMAYGNVEFRWKFLRTVLWNQNIYLALSAFLDGGMVTQKYKLQETSNNVVLSNFITNDPEKPHLASGVGFHFVLNENFIISADYGQSFDKRDGISGLYIGLGFLF